MAGGETVHGCGVRGVVVEDLKAGCSDFDPGIFSTYTPVCGLKDSGPLATVVKGLDSFSVSLFFALLRTNVFRSVGKMDRTLHVC